MTRTGHRARIRALMSGVAFLALVACTGGGADSTLGVSTVSEPLPHLAGPALHPDGGQIASSDFRGKPLVVNFWATWCGPCRQEQGILQGLWQRYHDRGVMFLGVDQRDDPSAAAAQLQDLGVTYPNLSDTSGAYANDFGFVGLPDTYVVDRSGTIRYQVIGRISDPSQLATLIDRVLAGSTGTA
jgi:cytochrome c biogenesis protein CcmG/thiol:disulfide interchange protein DsbE